MNLEFPIILSSAAGCRPNLVKGSMRRIAGMDASGDRKLPPRLNWVPLGYLFYTCQRIMIVATVVECPFLSPISSFGDIVAASNVVFGSGDES